MEDTIKFLVKYPLTKQYGVVQLAEEEDESKAKKQLLRRAKKEKMLEWCFLPKKYDYNIENNKKYVCFGLMANPFHTKQ